MRKLASAVPRHFSYMYFSRSSVTPGTKGIICQKPFLYLMTCFPFSSAKYGWMRARFFSDRKSRVVAICLLCSRAFAGICSSTKNLPQLSSRATRKTERSGLPWIEISWRNFFRRTRQRSATTFKVSLPNKGVSSLEWICALDFFPVADDLLVTCFSSAVIFFTLGSFFILISRRIASLLSILALVANKFTGRRERVYFAATPLLWAAKRLSILLVMPV